MSDVSSEDFEKGFSPFDQRMIRSNSVMAKPLQVGV
jgi:hypothetical protein